jgi:hypothetical protein
VHGLAWRGGGGEKVGGWRGGEAVGWVGGGGGALVVERRSYCEITALAQILQRQDLALVRLGFVERRSYCEIAALAQILHSTLAQILPVLRAARFGSNFREKLAKRAASVRGNAHCKMWPKSCSGPNLAAKSKPESGSGKWIGPNLVLGQILFCATASFGNSGKWKWEV